MISSIIVASACLGQMMCAPVVVVESNPIVIAPPLYIDYRLGGMAERTRQYLPVPYRDGKMRTVPVINGYVPGITHTRYADGSERIVYDYTICETYREVMRKLREKQERDREKEKPKVPNIAPMRLAPLVPIPDPKADERSVLVKPKEEPKIPPKEELTPLPKPINRLEPVLPLDEPPRVIVAPTYKENQ